MKKSLKRMLCSVLVLVFIFANANVVLAADVFEIKPKFVSPTLYASSEEVALAATLPFDEEKFQAYLLEQLKVLPADEECIVEIDISQFKIPYTDENYQALFNLIWYESPELFRVKELGVGGYSVLETLYVLCASDFCDPHYFAECSDLMESVVADLVKGVKGNNNLSDVEKALILHDRLATYCEYDYDRLNDGTMPKVSYTAYGILGLGTGVCMGYALAYDYLLEQVGIKSDYCSSSPEKLNHAWNIVYINNKPYHVDVTWDDPVRDVSGRVLHDNFLRSTEGIKATGHNADDFTTTPTDTTYDDYFWQDSDTAFQLIDNKIYYIDNVKQELYVIDDITDTEPETIDSLDYKWTNADGSWWSENYSKLASIRDNLFYSTPTKVYCYNVTEKTSEAIITNEDILATTGEEGYRIYGMTAVGCTLWGEYVKSPNYNVNTKQEQTFTKGYHNPTENWKTVIEPTSSSQGKEVNTCIDCGRELGSRLIPTLDDQHIWSEWHIDTNNPPTCTDKGVILRTCSHCDAWEWDYGTALGHDYSEDFIIDVQPTCGTTGVKYRDCSRCEAKVDITTIPATNEHKASSEWVTGKVATCGSAGYDYLPCANCGAEMERKTTEKLSHGETELVNKKSETCTTEGYTGDTRCKTCKTVITYGTKIAKSNHTPSDWMTKIPATYVSDGVEYRICTVCRIELETRTIPKKVHSSDGGTITKQPTCTENGVKTYKCTKCGEQIKTETIPAIGHKTSVINAKPATCTVDGYSGDTYCSTCKTTTVKGSVIKAKGHTTSVINAKAATCTADGYSGDTYCSTCKSTTVMGTVIKATGHKGIVEGKKDATISEAGYTGDKVCSVCKVVLEKGKEIPKIIVSLATPAVTIKNTAKGIEVKWNAIENAESYIVYRRVYNASTKKWSGWSKLKIDYTSTSYVDTTVILGTQYRYTVRAVNGDVMSKYESTATLKYNVKPTVKISNTASGVKVTWTTAANATGYIVYRSQYSGGKWSGWKNMGTEKANKTAWTDKNVKSGAQYKYTVRACYNKIKSSYKDSNTTVFLTQPTVKFSNASTGIKVSWSKVSGATGYTVYRSQYTNGKWSGWKNMGTAKSTKSSWTDKKVESGATYKYTVRAVNGNYKSTYTDTKGLLYLAQPTVTVKAVSNGINVAWTQCEGATGYTVYRSEYNTKTRKWSAWKSRGTAKATKSNWTDKKTTKGVTYRYTVRAVNADTGAKSSYVASKEIRR